MVTLSFVVQIISVNLNQFCKSELLLAGEMYYYHVDFCVHVSLLNNLEVFMSQGYIVVGLIFVKK